MIMTIETDIQAPVNPPAQEGAESRASYRVTFVPDRGGLDVVV
jgi:hypothetical protein